MWQWIGRGLVVVAAGVLAASFAGDVVGIGDSLAVFRPLILAGTLGCALLVWRWRVAQFCLLAVGCVVVWHGVGFTSYSDVKAQADVILYQKNMLYRPHDRAALVHDIRQTDADVVTLQEVSRANLATLDALRDHYPYRFVCNAHSVGAVAILSQTPLTAQTCAAAPGMATAVSDIGGVAVQIVSVHLHWLFPFSQQRHVADLLTDTALGWDGATIVGGDFNMVASGRTMAWFERATDTQRVGPLVRTYDLFGYPLGIDHVLASGGVGALDVRAQLGSDHYGLLAWIELP